jgi:hypothetical protein
MRGWESPASHFSEGEVTERLRLLKDNADAPFPLAKQSCQIMADNGAAAQQVGLQNWETQMQNANNQVNHGWQGLVRCCNLGRRLRRDRPCHHF